LSTVFGHLAEAFDRIPHTRFIAGWFVLALLLAGALVCVWSSVATRLQADGRPGAKQK
jgi:hypothetical protein